MDIRTLCLGILTMGDASGYEIKKMFEDQLSHFYEASFGSIYPALTRLANEGLVSCRAEAQAKRPDKKVYSITPSGRIAFLDALAESPGRDRLRSDFLAMMMFSQLLAPRHLSRVIDQRTEEFARQSSELTQCLAASRSPSQKFVIGYGIALYDAARAYLDDNRHIIESAALLQQVSAAD